MIIELSNVSKKKKKKTIECDKNIVICNIGIAQCDNRIVKYDKTNQGTTECDKSIVRSNVDIAQCDNRTIKCEKKIGYH